MYMFKRALEIVLVTYLINWCLTLSCSLYMGLPF